MTTRPRMAVSSAAWFAAGLTAISLLPSPGATARAPQRVPEISRRMRSGRLVLRPRVELVIYDPIVRSEGGRRLHEVCRWHDPIDLAAGYISDIARASGGTVQYALVESATTDVFPVKKDGF